MATTREQTWDLLQAALDSIDYIRDPLPDGSPRFRLHRDDPSNWARLDIFTYTPNTYRPGQMRGTRHEAVVPVATYNQDTWERWVFDRIQAIERHETAESFLVGGVRKFAPHHGPGEDPYVLWFDGHPDKQAKAPGEV